MPVFVFHRERRGAMMVDRDVVRSDIVGTTANPIVDRVWRLADPLCRSEGMELVYVEFHREPAGRTLRLYLDKPGGVTLEDCATVSRQLGDLLDVALDTQGAYRLEVSSPGQQRPLGKRDDFIRFQGSRAKVRTARPINGRRNFTGTLEDSSEAGVQIQVDNQLLEIAFADIVKAHLL